MPPKSQKGKSVTIGSEYEYYVFKMSKSFHKLTKSEIVNLRFVIYDFIRKEIPKKQSEVVSLNITLKNGKKGKVHLLVIHY